MSKSEGQCGSIDKINVFEIATSNLFERKNKNPMNEAFKKIFKERKKRSSGDDSDTEKETTLHFHSDTTFTINCVVIAIVVALFFMAMFVVYYFCNRDRVAIVVTKFKHTIAKCFRKG